VDGQGGTAASASEESVATRLALVTVLLRAQPGQGGFAPRTSWRRTQILRLPRYGDGRGRHRRRGPVGGREVGVTEMWA
jgi:hypothetical protein